MLFVANFFVSVSSSRKLKWAPEKLKLSYMSVLTCNVFNFFQFSVAQYLLLKIYLFFVCVRLCWFHFGISFERKVQKLLKSRKTSQVHSVHKDHYANVKLHYFVFKTQTNLAPSVGESDNLHWIFWLRAPAVHKISLLLIYLQRKGMNYYRLFVTTNTKRLSGLFFVDPSSSSSLRLGLTLIRWRESSLRSIRSDQVWAGSVSTWQ